MSVTQSGVCSSPLTIVECIGCGISACLVNPDHRGHGLSSVRLRSCKIALCGRESVAYDGHEIALHEDARFHGDLHDLASRPCGDVGEHHDPLVIDRLARERSHPECNFNDVIDARPAGFHRASDVGKHMSALLLDRRRKLLRGRIGSPNETGHDDIANA